MQDPTMQRTLWSAFALTLLVAGSPLAAVDGVLEIDQACVASGCFPGDNPGFPVEVAGSGSYRLTSNLAVPNANTTAISVTGDDVSIDLNGFVVSGITDCGVNLGDPCTPAGTGHGIQSDGGERTEVRNGTVRGMGSQGIALLKGPSKVEGVTAISNGGIGIAVEGVVSGCRVTRNGDRGIALIGVCAAVGNVVARNDGIGIQADAATCSIANNTIQRNDGAGILATAGGGTLVTGNLVTDNVGRGLQAGTNDGYTDNVFDQNGNGTPADQVSGAVQIGTNLCSSVSCP